MISRPHRTFNRCFTLMTTLMVIYTLIACATPSESAQARTPQIAANPTQQYFVPLVTVKMGLYQGPFTPTPTALPTATPTAKPVVSYTNIIFLHHSVGLGLIENGGLREKFHNLGYQFWDHDYNQPGLRKPTGVTPFFSDTGTNYNIPGDNTDLLPGLRDLFAQPLITSGVPPLPQNCVISGHENDKAFTCLMRHQVIIFKSCFPNSKIETDAKLEQYKQIYRAIVARADQYPNHIFITLGFPPLNAHDSLAPTAAEARRAREFTNWLATSPDVSGAAHPNFFVYNLFDKLAGTDNFLKPAYYLDANTTDSHPNAQAGRDVSTDFVNFVDHAIKSYAARP